MPAQGRHSSKNTCPVRFAAPPPNGGLLSSAQPNTNITHIVTFSIIFIIFTVDFVPEKTSVTRRPRRRKPSPLTKDIDQRRQKTCRRWFRSFGGCFGPFFAPLAFLRSLRSPRLAGLGLCSGFDSYPASFRNPRQFRQLRDLCHPRTHRDYSLRIVFTSFTDFYTARKHRRIAELSLGWNCAFCPSARISLLIQLAALEMKFGKLVGES